MRFMALASDYDNTLAEDGQVNEQTLEALKRLRDSGRHLILVTGRELDDLRTIFPHLNLFSRIVAENGGVLHRPDTGETRLLAPPPPPAFVKAMRERGVKHLGVSQTLVGTMRPNEKPALDAIRELGLNLHVIFNGEVVMIVSPGITKASGLKVALDDMGLSALNVVGVGDAENDHPLLEACGFAAAVGNALPALQERADWVMQGERGAGIVELIDAWLNDDLLTHSHGQHPLRLGQRRDAEAGDTVGLEPYGTVALVAGSSGGGKSTVTGGLLERLAEAGYQFCVFDPEGDYDMIEKGIVLGDVERAPSADEVLQLLSQPGQNVVINMLRIPLDERPRFCATLLPRLQELRVQTGRPHWLVFEEAHHLFPANYESVELSLPQMIETALAITVHPDQLAPAFLKQVNTLLAVGEAPEDTVAVFARCTGREAPARHDISLARGETLVWRPEARDDALSVVIAEPGRTERRRHVRKYAEGLLIPERSFYFKGPEGRLNLRAHNLVLFLELGDGVDAQTWQFHLQRGDYARWFEEVIGDAELAQAARAVQEEQELSVDEGRARIREAVEQRYTQPKNPCLPVLNPNVA